MRPLAGESPRPASALPSEGAQEAPREEGQSLRHSLRCDTVPQFSMGASLRSQSSLERLPASLGLLRPASATGGGLRAPLFAKREAIDGAIPENSACSSVGVPGIEKPPANASKEEYHAYLVRLQEHFAREDAAAAAERARQAAEHVPERRVPEFVRERLKQLRAQAAARRARERAESEARYRKALAAWFGDASAEKAECCA